MKKIFFIWVITLIFAGIIFAEEEFNYDSKGKRDPFVPLVSEGGGYSSDAYGIAGVSDIRLEGIVWDESKGSVAIINGEIVKEGDKIGFAKILKIEKGFVIFEIGGESIKIELENK